MSELVLLTLATFFLWSSIRYPAERYVGSYFDTTRVLHPLVVAALPLVVLWPEWVPALAVAGLVGLLVGVTDKYFGGPSPTATPFQVNRRRSGLPPLP